MMNIKNVNLNIAFNLSISRALNLYICIWCHLFESFIFVDITNF
jgi:hypothetical protein